MSKSYLTAIRRKHMSRPLAFLIDNKYIKPMHSVLDYGCGHGADVKIMINDHGIDSAKGFDPHWNLDYTALNNGPYDIVLCTYVLNVVGPDEQKKIIKQLKSLVRPNGRIYVSVRRDIKDSYLTARGTEQYVVKLPYKKIKENSQFCIYEIRG